MSTFLTVWNLVGRYKYLIVLVLFLVSILFVGDDSAWATFKRYKELSHMRAQLTLMREQYERDSLALMRLRTDPKEAEHVAREVYQMKRSGEDVYLIVPVPEKIDTLR